ncbi:MAG: cytochrome c oxidase subunit II [Microscillaceae bacterium]|nr:cytochrome c oxidase subunit II [Microscillaceae bacterium]
MLFRINTLVSVAQRSDNKRVGASNNINGWLMLIVPILGLIAGIWYTRIAFNHFLPPSASEHGVQTDNLFWITMSVITAMFIITNIGLFWFAFRYRYNEERKASFFHDNTRLEVFWTIVPAVIMALLVFFGWKVWHGIMEVAPSEEAIELEIMGKQFAWQVRYPGKDGVLGDYNYRLIDDAAGNEFGIDFEKKASEDDFIAREIHIPKGKEILLKIRARDVLHSVFAPHFRLKMDAVPGMPTQFRFVPIKTTEEMRAELGNPKFNYEIACTEVCGIGHFAMRYIIVVEDEADYKKWYAEQVPFLEQNPQFKGKGMSDLRKKNLADMKKETEGENIKTASISK